MNAGLLFLLRRGLRGRVRQIGRRVRTVKGALSFGAALLFLGGIAALQVLAAMLPETRGAAAGGVEDLRRLVPPVLVVLTFLGFVTGRALYFTPAEVDFLFPAPVGRRELLVYNLASRLGMQVLSALWTALFVLRYAPNAGYGLAALILAFVFMYVTAQAMGLAATAAESFLSDTARRVARAVFIVVLFVVVARAAAGAEPWSGAAGRIRAVADARPVQALSILTRPFAELFVAANGAKALAWAAACAAVIAAEVALLMVFDRAATERSLAVSRRVHARLQRLRAGGGAYAVTRSRLRTRLPSLGFLGGAAPLARRQLMELLRNPRAFIPAFLMAAVWLTAMLVGAREHGPGRGSDPVAILVMGVIFPILFTSHLPFDFRRDLDRMPLLRSLPLKPSTVAVGQIFPVALAFVVVQLTMVGVVAAALGGLPRTWVLVLALGVPPFSWAALALDNWMFLLMPYRVSTEGESNMQFLGKTMMAMFLKFVVLAILVGVSLLAAWGVWAATRGSMTAAIVAGSVVLAACCVPLTWLTGRAFAGFDLWRDVPG